MLKHAKTNLSFTHVQMIVLVGLVFLFASCSDSENSNLAPPDSGVPNSGERADLSKLNADETRVEIARLLNDGHVMYMRLEIFNSGGVYSFACSGQFASKPQVVCDTYPERIVRETWDSTDSAGIVRMTYGREYKTDGTLLATGIQYQWTDVASGETWGSSRSVERDLLSQVENMSETIKRVYDRNLTVTNGEILGRPSVIVPEGEFEYQIAIPMIQRQTRWQERDDGTQFMFSEAIVTDFAMLPPGSFPWQQAAHVLGRWTTADGDPVPSKTINTQAGPEHCDWQSVIFMSLAMPVGSLANSGTDSIQFLSDPLGVMSGIDGRFKGRFQVDTELPDDAKFSGYTKNGVELWISGSELETGIFMVEGKDVEKWPRVEPKILCA